MVGFADGPMGIAAPVAYWLPRVYVVSLTPAATNTITAVEQTFTVTGVETGDAIYVSPPSVTSGVAQGAARASAANQIAIMFSNPTAGNLTAPSGSYRVVAIRTA